MSRFHTSELSPRVRKLIKTFKYEYILICKTIFPERMIVTPLVLSTLLVRGEDKENRGQLGRGEACWRGTY